MGRNIDYLISETKKFGIYHLMFLIRYYLEM